MNDKYDTLKRVKLVGSMHFYYLYLCSKLLNNISAVKLNYLMASITFMG